MPLVSDMFHQERLEKENINIETKYIVGNDILVRNSNNQNNDDIIKGIRCEKNYYLKGILKHTEKEFDSRIEYTYISKTQEHDEYRCSNCGYKSSLKDFIDRCPYCKTNYNIDYEEKDKGSKYTYDLVLKNPLYRVITGVIDLIVSLILSYIFIITTSRTFNSYDISKIFIYGFVLALVLYYFFYTLDAYIILGPIRKYKEKMNKDQMNFWENLGIDKRVFFNNLHYEIDREFYINKAVIDYDILDYLSFEGFIKDDIFYVKVKINVRLVYLENEEFRSEVRDEMVILKRNEDGLIKLKDKTNMIRCSCGSTIDVTHDKCDFCGKEIKSIQEWEWVNDLTKDDLV